MRTVCLLATLGALGCATSMEITPRDIDRERQCQALQGRAYREAFCDDHARRLSEKRQALAAIEAEAARERQCYVTLEDPNATPEARGACRQYFAAKEAAAVEDADRRARIAAGLQGMADGIGKATRNNTVTTDCSTRGSGPYATTQCTSQ